jgi:hypothetical protein
MPRPTNAGSVGTMTSPRSAVRAAKASRAFRIAARLGYVVNGILNVAIGILAITVAASGGGGSSGAGPAEALQRIADAPGGALLIWVIAVGLCALGLWQVVTAVLVDEDDARHRWASRARSAGKAIAYLALAILATGVAIGRGGGGGSEESFAAKALSTPGGIVLVVAAGLIALGVGGYLVAKGVRRTFLDDIRPPSGRAGDAVTILGVAGYVARGIAIGVVGVLFIIAAVTSDSSRAGGLDDSLAALAGLPFGRVVLIAVGLGFIAYGVYGAVRARYAKL